MTVRLVFQLAQHTSPPTLGPGTRANDLEGGGPRDEQLIRSLVEYFNWGFIIKYKNAFYSRVEKFSDIENKIIPFFSLNRIQGVKFLDYID